MINHKLFGPASQKHRPQSIPQVFSLLYFGLKGRVDLICILVSESKEPATKMAFLFLQEEAGLHDQGTSQLGLLLEDVPRSGSYFGDHLDHNVSGNSIRFFTVRTEES